ncbi:T9SS type A sorting domain-containing protein [Adhaeribacter pallidiroseus]|uniref:Dyslexia-associated protein KIAA0319 like protein n=1 Tax=Adhaeribacter pallidiroseus TaxID=2072847 RepID=A0A369QCY3_9BACT|nr:T9SS type A sorting domain-containing protein [Adhaeribacter pallidiroseus]RDC62761.1 Dyslexia-associated protein KIAA0319 like protein [Adhaeribacter pallidiroseus]
MIRKFTQVILPLLLCFFSGHKGFTQDSYRKIWDKSFGGSQSDALLTTIPIKGGGYLLGGTSNSNDSGTKSNNSKGAQDYWVVKTDATGNRNWDKTFGGSSNDYLQTAQQTSDGGFILGGATNSPVSGDRSFTASSQYDYWLVKINASGDKVWDKSYGGTGNDHLKSICPTRDGGYILAGSSNSTASGRASYNKTSGSRGEQDYWIVKIDAAGNKQWDKTYGGSSYDFLQVVQPTSDNGYILAGHSYSPKSGEKSDGGNQYGDFWLVKIDASGNKQWDKTYGGNQEETLKTCLLTNDGGFLLAGSSNSSSSGEKSGDSKGLSDFWVLKTDANGNKQWDRTFGGANNDYLQGAANTPDKGFILGGTSTSPAGQDKSSSPKGSADFWILKISASGTKKWDKTYGGDSYDNLHHLLSLDNGNCLLSGTSASGSGDDKNSSSLGETDYWLVALDSDGTSNPDPDPDPDPEPDKLVESFTLVNADTDTDIQTLSNNAVLNLGTLPTRNLNIRANTSTNNLTVTFKLSGAETLERSEANAPYIVFGAAGSDYESWVPTAGNYTLEAIPSDNGQAGTPLIINFQVISSPSENQKPVASAGGNTSLTLPTNSLVLPGSGSDPDGTVEEFDWSQLSGPNTATFSSKTVAKPTVSNLVAGTYTFSLVVRDNDQAQSNADQISVTVNSANSSGSPVVSFTLMNATTDTELFELTDNATLNMATLPTTNLNVRANTNTNAVSLAFRLSGQQTLSRSEGGAPYSVFGDSNGDYKNWVPALGDYTLSATPSINGVAGTPLVVKFRVIKQTSGNQAPVAEAGFNTSITLPTSTLTLNGSGTDADGTITKYQWSQASGPNVATFNNKAVAKPTVSNLVAGTYVFRLIVTDNANAVSTADQVTISVNSSGSAGQQVVSYSLMNADSDTEIQTIENGTIINLTNLPTKNLNIRANTNPGKVGSLVYAVSGVYTINKSETAAPYALFGDQNGDFAGVSLGLGSYTLKATPYTLAGGTGTMGTALTINFKVVRTAASAPYSDSSVVSTDSLAQNEASENDYLPESSLPEIIKLTNFPNPFEDKTAIQFSLPESQEYTLEVYDLNGTLIRRLPTGTALAHETVTAYWEADNTPNGIYLVKLITKDEVQHLQIMRGEK